MLQGDSRSRVVAAGVILPVRVWHVAPPEVVWLFGKCS